MRVSSDKIELQNSYCVSLRHGLEMAVYVGSHAPIQDSVLNLEHLRTCYYFWISPLNLYVVTDQVTEMKTENTKHRHTLCLLLQVKAHRTQNDLQ
jgi:hypothetical protein